MKRREKARSSWKRTIHDEIHKQTRSILRGGQRNTPNKQDLSMRRGGRQDLDPVGVCCEFRENGRNNEREDSI